MRRAFVVALLPFLAACGMVRGVVSRAVPCGYPLATVTTSQQAYDALVNAQGVELHVGITGAPSCLLRAHELLVNRPSAPQLYERMYWYGTTAGRIYALDGLRQVAPERYADLRTRPFFASTEKVAFHSGCVLSEATVADLTRMIDSGGFRGY